MKYNLQVLATMGRATEPECRRCLGRVLGNGLSQGALDAYEVGDVTDRLTTGFEIEGLLVIEADSPDGARFIAAEVCAKGVEGGEILSLEMSGDVTAQDEEDVESMDEVPQ